MGETVKGGPHYRMLFVLGVVLFLLTCALNLASDLIVKGIKKSNQG
jgi:ABC-type phosphate transport system permease subunit